MTQRRGSTEATGDDPLIGKLVAGRYRIRRFIAHGGMGRIYQAEQVPIGRTVAIKILRLGSGSEEPDEQEGEFSARFLREASALGKLNHANTVTVFDYGYLEAERLYFMVMEFVAGETIASRLKRMGPFDPIHALSICYEIARSLSEAHQHGLVHRDLKPSNVMLVESGEGEAVRVLDFGIVKVLAQDAEDITRKDRIVGSPRYMAPEQIRAEELDGRTDLYALGVMLYEMLSGKIPYPGGTAVQVFIGHLQHPLPSIEERAGRQVPEVAEAIARRCLRKRQEDRFSDAEALKVAIRDALRALGEEVADGSDVHRAPSHAEPRGGASSSEATTVVLPRDMEVPKIGLVRLIVIAVVAGVIAALGVVAMWVVLS